nr:MBL fold metallo-hydrolase [Primorskyibacter marinus]
MPKEMTMPDPDPSFRPRPGLAETLQPGLRRIVANNPSPMTFRGTNTYLLGTEDLAVIDPGPNDPAHLRTILGSVGPDQRISHIFVTHAHLDHSPLARPLAAATRAPVLAFGDARSGRSAVMQQLVAQGFTGGGEGVDAGFVPDICLPDGAQVSGNGWCITALHTPGHFGNHLCYASEDFLFSGDLVMGWASSVVSPPDGDLTDFMASCRHLAQMPWNRFYPGHGAAIEQPHTRLEWLLKHRKDRETAILDALKMGPDTAHGLTSRIYTDIPTKLIPAAERNVLAHLIDLKSKSLVHHMQELRSDSTFLLV